VTSFGSDTADSAVPDSDFFDDFLIALLRGVFGSIAIYKYLHFKI
jgi:hypothetical protein